MNDDPQSEPKKEQPNDLKNSENFDSFPKPEIELISDNNIKKSSEPNEELNIQPENEQYEEPEEQIEENNLKYDRYQNKFYDQYKEYVNKHYAYVTETENEIKSGFRSMLNVEEVNVFFDLELEKNIDDVTYYFNFDEFEAKTDPDQVKSLLNESIQILTSNQTNLQVDKKTIEQVRHIHN